MAMQLRGVMAALLTPFTQQQMLDTESLRRLVQFNIEQGIDGLYVGGSTGEAFVQSLSEREQVMEIVRALAEPLAKELGLIIWDVTFTKEGADWYLRIFIDKEGGVGIDDCVDLTHAINPVLDSEDPIPQEYTLEVSSPGINRKLTRPEHFEAFLEAPVRVKLIRPLENGVRELEGILIDVAENGDFEVITEEDTTVTFTRKECASVNLIEDYD